ETKAFRYGGAGVLFQPNMFELLLREMSAAAQHIFPSESAYESHGKFLLGLPDLSLGLMPRASLLWLCGVPRWHAIVSKYRQQVLECSHHLLDTPIGKAIQHVGGCGTALPARGHRFRQHAG